MRSCDMRLTIVLLLLASSIYISYCKNNVNNISEEENLELERILKLRNKPPVKTIETDDGRIIDCIDVHKQPSLDHPLLKNHKVQLRPSYIPEGLKRKHGSKKNHLEVRLKKVNCPKGTVPIKRTTKEDLIRTKSLREKKIIGNNVDYGEQPALPIESVGTHKAYVKVRKTENVSYGGVSGAVTVFNLSVDPDQSTSANIWAQSEGYLYYQNFITVGWQINPTLNGDYATRLFTYWAGNDNLNGCYNLLCNGFVQVNPRIPPDIQLRPVSIPGGQQYFIKLALFPDRESYRWWLMISSNNYVVGYWPGVMFTSQFGYGANEVGWGGQTKDGGIGISPPMGNGYKPSEHYEKSCYFADAAYLSQYGDQVLIPQKDDVETYVDKSGCYFVDNDGYQDDNLRYVVRFGGPGGEHCRT